VVAQFFAKSTTAPNNYSPSGMSQYEAN